MQISIKNRSLIFSSVFHVILLIILMYTFLTTPNPPMGGGEGLLVNIGYIDMGSGEVQPFSEDITIQPVKEMSTPESQSQNDVVTQELEETEKIKIEENKTAIKKDKEPDPIKDQAEKQEVQKVINTKALYKGKANNSTSQGNDIKADGDKGSSIGDPNSLAYGKSGDGNNQKGEGGSEGSGVSYNLSGRKLKKTPGIIDKSQESGKVVVDIKVDKYGNVVRATAGARGSTTTSTILYKKAEQAALKAKFDANPEAPEEQRGIMTFVFILE